jgi:hypothetical protein
MPCAIIGYPPTGGAVTILEIYDSYQIARDRVHDLSYRRTMPLTKDSVSYELSKVKPDAKIGDILRITPGWM